MRRDIPASIYIAKVEIWAGVTKVTDLLSPRVKLLHRNTLPRTDATVSSLIAQPE